MRSRTRTVLGGLAALVAMLLALVAIPIALYHFAGNPIPSQLPSLDQLRDTLSRPDDGTNLVAVLKVVGWLAWAASAICILYEFASQLRGARAPRIPIAGNMVAAVLALTALGVATAAAPRKRHARRRQPHRGHPSRDQRHRFRHADSQHHHLSHDLTRGGQAQAAGGAPH